MFVPGSDELPSGEVDLEYSEPEETHPAFTSNPSSDYAPQRVPEWSPTESMRNNMDMSITLMEAMDRRRHRADRDAVATEDEEAGDVAGDAGYSVIEDVVLGDYLRRGHSGFAGNVPDEADGVYILGEYAGAAKVTLADRNWGDAPPSFVEDNHISITDDP